MQTQAKFGVHTYMYSMYMHTNFKFMIQQTLRKFCHIKISIVQTGPDFLVFEIWWILYSKFVVNWDLG